jgi:hypothetical protein
LAASSANDLFMKIHVLSIKRFERNGLYLLAALVTTKAFGSERPKFIQSAGMLERLSQSKNLLSPSQMSIQICRLPFV